MTLTPTVPLTQSVYIVQPANAGKSPTDLQGNTAFFNGIGGFDGIYGTIGF